MERDNSRLLSSDGHETTAPQTAQESILDHAYKTRKLDRPLTPTERLVAKSIVAGQANKRIAALLGISTRTVESHVASLCQKLGVHSRLQAALRILQAPGEVDGQR